MILKLKDKIRLFSLKQIVRRKPKSGSEKLEGIFSIVLELFMDLVQKDWISLGGGTISVNYNSYNRLIWEISYFSKEMKQILELLGL